MEETGILVHVRLYMVFIYHESRTCTYQIVTLSTCSQHRLSLGYELWGADRHNGSSDRAVSVDMSSASSTHSLGVEENWPQH